MGKRIFLLMKNVLRVVLVVLVLMWLLWAESFAYDIRVLTSFDKRTVELSDTVVMTIKVIGKTGNLKKPVLPSVEGFDIYYVGRTSSYDFVDGESVHQLEFKYSLDPKKPGVFAVGPFEVDVDGVLFRTDKIMINVVTLNSNFSNKSHSYSQPQSQPQPYSQPKPPVLNGGTRGLFFQVSADKNEVYLNEQVLFTYTVYTCLNVRYEGFAEDPEMLGFWFEEIDDKKELLREEVMLGGQRYAKVDVRKIAVFPTKPGEYEFNPGSIKCSVRTEKSGPGRTDDFFNDNFFGGSVISKMQSKILKAEPIKIIVKDFPTEGRTEVFSGASGEYELSVDLDKRSAAVNEPLSMIIKVTGKGNLEMLDRPFIEPNSDFELFDADTSIEMSKSKGEIKGIKTFRVTLIPKKSGELVTPAVLFDYFNTNYRAFMHLKNGNIPIKVISSKVDSSEAGLSVPDEFKEEIVIETRDIEYINEKQTNPLRTTKLVMLLSGINFFSIIALVLVFFAKKREDALNSDVKLKRRIYAFKDAKKQIRSLKNLQKHTDHKFFEEAARMMDKFIADKFNASAQGLTWLKVKGFLESSECEPGIIDELKEFYDYCNMARFASAKIDNIAFNRIFDSLISIIEKLERTIK